MPTWAKECKRNGAESERKLLNATVDWMSKLLACHQRHDISGLYTTVIFASVCPRLSFASAMAKVMPSGPPPCLIHGTETNSSARHVLPRTERRVETVMKEYFCQDIMRSLGCCGV